MNENLKKQLEEIEQRGNFIEMDNVLMANMGLAVNDADYAIYTLKSIVHGGMSIGRNAQVAQLLNKSGSNERDGNFFDRMLAKKANDVIDIGKGGILMLTNSYFILAIKTAITYGNSDIIDQAAKLICPLYSPIGEMLKHKKTINFETYSVVAALMCMVGNTIADSVVQTNKTNFPGSKNIIGGFVESVMIPLKSFISGFFGFFVGSSVPRNIRNQVNDTYQKMVKMA